MERTSVPYTLLVLSCMLWSTIATAVCKICIFVTSESITPLPPSQDPFYAIPPGYEDAAPGAVLRVRNAPGNLTKIVANSSAAYNILYRTTDSNYGPSWAVTTLFVPQNCSTNSTANDSTAHSDPAAPSSALLSYQVAYDSPDVDDSPSYRFYSGQVSIDPLITIALGLGWYVNTPDYEGPLASFTAGVKSGHATIDSVRAVLNSGFGLDSNTKYAMSGYSGGAIASEWAAELQVQYAPEMNFAGVALGGLAPNITSSLETVNGGPFSELIVWFILGAITQDPVAEQYVLSQLKSSGPYNATGFLAARNLSSFVDAPIYDNQDILDEYFDSGASVLRNSPLRALFDRDGTMGFHGVPSMPVFVDNAIRDELISISDTDALIQRYCSIGANILYQRNTVGGHIAEAGNGVERTLAFLSAVLSGTYNSTYNTDGCTIQNVTMSTDTSPLRMD